MNLKDKLRKKTEQHNKENGGKDFGKRYLDVPDNIGFYSIKNKWNYIDIMPFYFQGGILPGATKNDIDYVLDIYVHRFIGPKNDSFICLQKTLGKACPICEEYESSQEDNFKPKRRAIYLVYDKKPNEDDKDPKGLKIFDAVHYFFEKELNEAAGAFSEDEDSYICFADPENGKIVKFYGSKESFNSFSFFKFKNFQFIARKKNYKLADVKNIPSLDSFLIIPTYDEMKASLYGEELEDEDESNEPPLTEDDFEKEEPDEELEIDSVEVEEDSEPEKPKRRKRKKKSNTERKCPYGYNFGKEYDEWEDCDTCAIEHTDINSGCRAMGEEL